MNSSVSEMLRPKDGKLPAVFWRGKAKLLTTWPSEPLLRLHDTWRFSGARQQLRNGKYELFVWPAFGTLAKVSSQSETWAKRFQAAIACPCPIGAQWQCIAHE